MKTYRFALLLGDGAGPALCAGAERLLRALGNRFGWQPEIQTLPFGRSAYDRLGDPLPEETVQGITSSDAALIFALQTGGMPGMTPVGRLRKELGLFAEVREAVSGPEADRPEIRIAFVREITQGFLADRNLFRGCGEWMPDEHSALSLRVITREASSRIAAYAFDYAARAGYGLVTAAHKASILKLTDGLFLEACRAEAAKHPEITYEEANVDDLAGDLIRKPERYGVIVTTNLFGDILSDEGAALVRDRCAGINIGEKSRVYLPVVHKANPEAAARDAFACAPAMTALGLALRDLGETEAAALLARAAEKAEEKGLTGSRFLAETEDGINS